MVPTTGNGEQVGLPGDDVEHAPDGDAGKSAVEATQAKVDGIKRRGNAECWRRKAPVLRVGSHRAHLPSWSTPLLQARISYRNQGQVFTRRNFSFIH